MALLAAYKEFLAAPKLSSLASDASLHYITTLVTVSSSSEIIRHLNAVNHQLKKREEKFLDVVEGAASLAAEIHTTVEFLTGGGPYLPGLDDNFLADRTVTIPIIHIVSFDANGKIQQVRQNWDQGSLLKIIDVIGKTGRNWPIHDGKDQIKLISSSIKSAGKATTDPSDEANDFIMRSRGNSTNVTRDPHATLSLFGPRDNTVQESLPAVVAPRASAKPPPRDYQDLFVGNVSDPSPVSPLQTTSNERLESPYKPLDAVAPKIGSGKHFAPSRLFDNDENSPLPPSPDKNHSAEHFYRTHPTKFQHFDFADGSDPQDAPPPAPATQVKSKHASQWTFDDFQTPQKLVPTKTLRPNNVVHWGTSEDEVVDSPIKVKKVDKPRKDAETHFEFRDDGTPEGGPRVIGRPRGAGQNTGLGLYQNNLYDDGSGTPRAPEVKPLNTIANIKDRRKDFDAQFSMTDESPAAKPGPEVKPLNTIANIKDRRKDFDSQFSMTDQSPAAKPAPERISEDRAKVVKMMDANWSSYDQSPNQKENLPVSPSTSRPNTGTGKGPLSESTNTMSNRNDNPKGINIGGDGMGGKKGTVRSWGIGDDSDGEETGGVNSKGNTFRTGKQMGKSQPLGGDFWDF